jgi:hypothetical protein
MKRTKLALVWTILCLGVLGLGKAKAQPFEPIGNTQCILVSSSCITGLVKIRPQFDMHLVVLDSGTYRVQIRLYRGEWVQQFNVGYVTNQVLVNTISSPSKVISTNMTFVDFGMTDFFFNSPLFSGTNQNGIYRAQTTLQRWASGSWSNVASTTLEDTYVADDIPPIEPCETCDEILRVEDLKRGPFFKFSINGNFGETPPHTFYSCSGVPLILHATGWTGTTGAGTLTATKGIWSSGSFTPTASPQSISINPGSLYLDQNLTTLFSLSNYSGYLRVTYTLPSDVCDGVVTPVTQTQIIQVTPATFLGNYTARVTFQTGCTPAMTGTSKPICLTPNITATMPSNTSFSLFKCELGNANSLGWQGARSAGISSLSLTGNYEIEVYEADASGDRKVVNGISAPAIFLLYGSDTGTVGLSFNSPGYGAGFNSSHPFYVDTNAAADPAGNFGGGDYFEQYYDFAYDNGTLSAYSAKIFCAEVRQVTEGGCIVNKKSYFRIANNGLSNGHGARPTGIEDMEEGFVALEIVPNPGTGIFTITYDQPSGATIEVLDMFGRSLKKTELTGNAPYRLDLSGEAKGIYLLKLSSEGKTQTKKMVLQ